MIVKGKVNIRWQIILVLLPITLFNLGGFYAAYRIKKLRKFVLIYLIAIVMILIFDGVPVIEDDDIHYVWSEDSIMWWLDPVGNYFGQTDIKIKLFWIIENVIWYGILIFFVERWSRQWNEKFGFIQK